ncbi:MAG TPA: ABC transporter ATP-binding protein [Bryobacteraceae bacterium]
MSNIAIHICNLSKSFPIGARPAKYQTLRDHVASLAAAPFQRRSRSENGATSNRSRKKSNFWALRNVSFDVPRGQVVGIVGRNGAGKSTLLKILSRISDPTEGYADMCGRTGALLEVGTGFHPELTGRENIYLNGAILGMTRAEIQKNFDEIVAFSEVERFIDTAVKHYSSGMYLRLAFAVASQLEPEILLMDEVLAVGDAAFQKKCIGRMSAVAQQGRTVLFVSHNMTAIKDLCSRAIWLEDGAVAADGEVDDVVAAYLNAMAEGAFRFVNSDFRFSIEQVLVRNADGIPTRQIGPCEDLTVEVIFDAAKPIRRPYVQIVIESLNGRCFTASMLLDGCQPDTLSGRGVLSCTFEAVPLLPQSYTVKLAIRAADGREHILRLQDVAAFEVDAELESVGLTGNFRGLAHRSTPVMIPYRWTLPDGTVMPVALKRASIGTAACDSLLASLSSD